MRKKFLVCSDYGMGGTWAYLLADSEKQILDQFWGLVIRDEVPEWFSDTDVAFLEKHVYDIDNLDSSDPLAQWLLKQRRLVLPSDVSLRRKGDK